MNNNSDMLACFRLSTHTAMHTAVHTAMHTAAHSVTLPHIAALQDTVASKTK